MEGSVVVVIVLSGLCFLPVRFNCLYIFVEEQMTWTEAQRYCRENYTDLASVHCEQDLAQLDDVIYYFELVWIGLHQSYADSWRWSLGSKTHYGEEEGQFSMWAPGEPSGLDQCKHCVAMTPSGEWMDQLCTKNFYFICYNGTSFVSVHEALTWEEAQSYCREHYTDLASVGNQADNFKIANITTAAFEWIGLYRETFTWSDRTPLTFRNWHFNDYHMTRCQNNCVASFQGKWFPRYCNNMFSFVCYSAAHQMTKQVVRVGLKKNDSSVDMEELKKGILQELHQRLVAHGLSEDVKLKWVTQPDGKVFHTEGKSSDVNKHLD